MDIPLKSQMPNVPAPKRAKAIQEALQIATPEDYKWIEERQNSYFDGPAKGWKDIPEDMICYAAVSDWWKRIKRGEAA